MCPTKPSTSSHHKSFGIRTYKTPSTQALSLQHLQTLSVSVETARLITPVDSALTRFAPFNSFRMCTYKKWWGTSPPSQSATSRLSQRNSRAGGLNRRPAVQNKAHSIVLEHFAYCPMVLFFLKMCITLNGKCSCLVQSSKRSQANPHRMNEHFFGPSGALSSEHGAASRGSVVIGTKAFLQLKLT